MTPVHYFVIISKAKAFDIISKIVAVSEVVTTDTAKWTSFSNIILSKTNIDVAFELLSSEIVTITEIALGKPRAATDTVKWTSFSNTIMFENNVNVAFGLLSSSKILTVTETALGKPRAATDTVKSATFTNAIIASGINILL